MNTKFGISLVNGYDVIFLSILSAALYNSDGSGFVETVKNGFKGLGHYWFPRD